MSTRSTSAPVTSLSRRAARMPGLDLSDAVARVHRHRGPRPADGGARRHPPQLQPRGHGADHLRVEARLRLLGRGLRRASTRTVVARRHHDDLHQPVSSDAHPFRRFGLLMRVPPSPPRTMGQWQPHRGLRAARRPGGTEGDQVHARVGHLGRRHADCVAGRCSCMHRCRRCRRTPHRVHRSVASRATT